VQAFIIKPLLALLDLVSVWVMGPYEYLILNILGASFE
jgi:hypothetical protein